MGETAPDAVGVGFGTGEAGPAAGAGFGTVGADCAGVDVGIPETAPGMGSGTDPGAFGWYLLCVGAVGAGL